MEDELAHARVVFEKPTFLVTIFVESETGIEGFMQ